MRFQIAMDIGLSSKIKRINQELKLQETYAFIFELDGCFNVNNELISKRKLVSDYDIQSTFQRIR